MGKWNLPTALDGGELLPHVSARMRTQTIDAIYEGLGGPEAHLAHAQKNDENKTEFYKLWGKGAARSGSVEVHASQGVESMLKKLDERDRQRELDIIDVTATAVE